MTKYSNLCEFGDVGEVESFFEGINKI